MEKSELGTLKPCLNPTFNFPPPRRRPLQSQTYRTFVRILSHCNALQSSSKSQGEDGSESGKLGEAGKGVVHESSMEVENSLVQQMPPVNGAKDINLGEVGKHIVNDSSMEKEGSLIQQMSPINGAKDALTDVGNLMLLQGTRELTLGDIVNPSNSSMLSNLSTVVENHKKLSPRIEQNVPNEVYEAANQPTRLEEITDMPSKLSPRREQNEICRPLGNEVYEAASQLADLPEPVGSLNEENPVIESNFPDEFEHQLQLKQSTLEELISASGDLDISVYEFDDEHIEEGEIPEGNGVDDEAIAMLFEDDISLEEKLDEVGVRELVNDNDGDRGIGKDNIKSSPLLGKVEDGKDVMRTTTREEQNANPKCSRENVSLNHANGYDYNMETGWFTKQVSVVEMSNNLEISSQNVARRRQITYEDISENKGSATAPMEVSGVKKRKKGPLTEERKAKKKMKYRINRAEKNRKLGVRRLKLQPVLKPKKVVYCRHFLRGRCQEGEKCKFSHDTTPETKSTPCSFFARGTCMKGDDCPYDHQLSKYPCNNIATTGFCSRGADCLFNHEVSSTIQVNKDGITDQRIDAKLPTKDISVGKKSGYQVHKNLERSVAHVPKGMPFFSQVISPTGNIRNREGDPLCLKPDDHVKTSNKMASNLSSSKKKSNEILNSVPVKPQGINFLSLGKSPMDDFANMRMGACGSLSGLLTKNGFVGSSPSSDGDVKTDNQAAIGSSSESASAVNKMAMEVPPSSTPEGIKFLSVGSVAVNTVNSTVNQSSNSSNNVNSGQAHIQGKQNSVEALNFVSRTANVSSSSFHPPWQSLNHGAGIFGGGNSSSSSKPSLLSGTPKSVQSPVQYALDFAGKIESERKVNRPAGNPFSLSRK
ncbi:OLC1v1037741C1 [Oldenlandia corymbosa var. corymbosa]|uniref:OLC1v1037741C1 n=1 Tax=Oldenlandia corymbosa var. corymbosa TaxID=529605 RepID=A0AAV1CZM6_OLDCO|nr:OLC1v1037741C1 [Oldenlandia corymbosa var. corymbosa]